MGLLNFSTTVPSSRTAHQMVELLAKHGATQILLDYARLFDAGSSVTGLSFAIDTEHGLMRYKLPVHTSAVEKVLRDDRTVPKRFKTAEQGERVAWRILKDWLEAQLALLETRMVTLDEIFLPYMLMDGGRTVFDVYRDQQLAIGPGDAL